MPVKKSIYLSLFVALAMTLHIVETFIPLTFVIPGAKLGLANIVTLLVLVTMGLADGLKVSILRTVLGSLMSGTFMTVTFFLSFSGALVSTLAMGLVLHLFSSQFSLVGVSILGAVAHNLAQVTTAYFIIDHAGLFFYLPYLLIFAIPTGLFVGFVVHYTQRHMVFNSSWRSLKDI